MLISTTRTNDEPSKKLDLYNVLGPILSIFVLFIYLLVLRCYGHINMLEINHAILGTSCIVFWIINGVKHI